MKFLNFLKSSKSLNCLPVLLSFCLAPTIKLTNSYYLQETWPDTQVNSLQIYGSAVAIDKTNNNNVIILHRSTSMISLNSTSADNFIQDDVIMILDFTTGNVLGNWGKGLFVRPHGIEVTEDGDLFVSDVKLHQVFKFGKDTGNRWKNRPTITLGEPFVPGNDEYHFCSPADISVSSITKDIFIADGYCNSRIVKFNKDGLYIGEFVAGTSAPNLSPVVPFNVTHAVAVASPSMINEDPDHTMSALITKKIPLVFVADRNNGRVQCFTEYGHFLYEITHKHFNSSKAMIFSLALTSPTKLEPYGKLYVVNGHLPLGQAKVFEVFVSNLGFNVTNSFALSIPKKNSDNANYTNLLERTEVPHDIAVSSDGNTIFIIEAYKSLIVKKFARHSLVPAPASSGNSSLRTTNIILMNLQLAVITMSVLFQAARILFFSCSVSS